MSEEILSPSKTSPTRGDKNDVETATTVDGDVTENKDVVTSALPVDTLSAISYSAHTTTTSVELDSQRYEVLDGSTTAKPNFRGWIERLGPELVRIRLKVDVKNRPVNTPGYHHLSDWKYFRGVKIPYLYGWLMVFMLAACVMGKDGGEGISPRACCQLVFLPPETTPSSSIG